MTHPTRTQVKLTPMTSTAPATDPLSVIDAARAAAVAHMEDAPLPTEPDGLIRELNVLGQLAEMGGVVHERIARLCVRGQDRAYFEPRVTQEDMARALGVSGPRVNKILKDARRRAGRAAEQAARSRSAGTATAAAG